MGSVITLLAAANACGDDQEVASLMASIPTPDATVPEASLPTATPDAEVIGDGDGDSNTTPVGDGDADRPDSGAPGEDVDPIVIGGLTVNASVEDQADLDLFGTAGHRFWMEVNQTQLERMNSGEGGGGGWYGDIYTPGSAATYADHVVVEDAQTRTVADYGKMEIKLVGESTMRQWTTSTIPNVRIDTDEFQADVEIGDFEHIRLNNSLVGSIFREHLAHRIYRELGYPALRSSYAFLGSSVWGEDVWVPMTLIEVYKRHFCKDNADLIGGGETCPNMWEFAGDVGNGGYWGMMQGGAAQALIAQGDAGYGLADAGIDYPPANLPANACQVKECDNSRMDEFVYVLNGTPADVGFKDALDPYISWDHFHRFQCLSWILWTGDDMLHNSNNNLIIEREDGKFVWAPYSVDISAGQDWYINTPLTGGSSIPWGCQHDPECWADTIAACETLIDQFDDLNPELMVDETVELLDSLGMMRDGDDERAEMLREWFVTRQLGLSEELERYRYLPDGSGNCPNDLQLCNDETCGTPEECQQRICYYGQIWCDSTQQCIYDMDYCPSCTEEAPYFCSYSYECEASEDYCHSLCEQYNPGYEFCAYYNDCVPIEWGCPSSNPCGGDGGTCDGGVGFGGNGPGGFGGMAGFAGAPMMGGAGGAMVIP